MNALKHISHYIIPTKFVCENVKLSIIKKIYTEVSVEWVKKIELW